MVGDRQEKKYEVPREDGIVMKRMRDMSKEERAAAARLAQKRAQEAMEDSESRDASGDA